ncbi:hypothetical protein TBR22_A18210 [Luteitalea sp. TBR-22]|uniref:antibiotic biosynthesis monooxygenase n=1 Tax=Luteitalea sp. TBR-22 TaxID=2802971 RepID=UPI001AF8DBA3|nr:antibiotic biosynthesis monooxygenase [Luteitalea sp. TBR-22]BCS32607.1 hypothetical protein TBR22_A18210 [Luteitalea sp. TBR-22]
MTITNVVVPSKLVHERVVGPSDRARFEAWASRYVAAASRAPGHEGTSVIGAASGEYFVLVRFDSEASLQAWRASAAERSLLAEADTFSRAADAPQVRTGLETWFTLPDGRVPTTPPPAWKMAVTTWVALYPMALVLARLLMPVPMPFVVNVALNTAIPVALLTWVAMPWLTRVLAPWLYGRTGTSGRIEA